MPLSVARAAVQVEVPLTTSKVQETLGAIEGRKEYYLKKRQSIKDGTYDAEKDPEAHSKKSPSRENGATTSNGFTANGDISEEFEHVSVCTGRVPPQVIMLVLFSIFWMLSYAN